MTAGDPSATLQRIDTRRPPLPAAQRATPLILPALVVGTLAAGSAAGELALMLRPPASPWVATLFPVAATVYVATGLAAWLRRPGSHLGLLLVFGGMAWLLAGLVNSGVPSLVAAGAVGATVPLAVIVHLLVSFPTGRLHGRAERVVVLAGYAVSLLLQAPLYLFAPGTPLSVADRPGLVEAGLDVQRAAGALVVAATVVLLVRRTRRATAAQRHVLVPLTTYGIFAVLVIPVSSGVADRWFDGGGLGLPAVQLVVLSLVPVGFLLAASRGGFGRTTGLADLGAWLGADDRGRPALEGALASALGDPSLRLLFRLPGEPRLVDDRGVAAGPRTGGARGRVDVGPPDDPVGAIDYDAGLLDRQDEVAEAGRVVALAVDRERLTVDLRASRARIAAAADDERRRIARDLHDGLQARLVFLGVQLGIEGASDDARAGLQTAIDELREVVDGVMPTPLTERGLPSATADLADRLPMPVALTVEGFGGRLAPEVETAAYRLISEALGNAVKHAAASTLEVALLRGDGELRVVVRDDGRGGARDGGGMRGMADRIHAVGGRVEVESPAGAGTRVEAVIPCAS